MSHDRDNEYVISTYSRKISTIDIKSSKLINSIQLYE